MNILFTFSFQYVIIFMRIKNGISKDAEQRLLEGGYINRSLKTEYYRQLALRVASEQNNSLEVQSIMADPEKVTEETAEEVPASIEERISAIEGVVMELIDKVEAIVKSVEDVKKTAVTKPKGLFGGKRKPTPTKDLKTGTVYASKAAVGKSLATEAGADPLDTMAYYTVIKNLKMSDGSDRFVDASEEEGAKALAEKKAQIEKEVAEANARIAAEEAAKAKAAKEAAKK